jgi:hypothetical protein
MHDRINSKYLVVGLITLAALFVALGAIRYEGSQSNGRFQLVVRHTDSGGVFVIDTATGQVWTNKYRVPDEVKRGLYEAKLSHGQ